MDRKWHLGFFRPEFVPTERGFDTFVGFYGGEEDYFTKNFTENGYNGYDFRNMTRVIQNHIYSTYVYRDESLRIMKKHVAEQEEDPFFLYLPFQAPHAPFQAPISAMEKVESWIESENRRKLGAAMIELDDTIGQIVDYLKSEDSGYLWDNTILIISSDNGGDTDYEASNYPLRGTKGTLYEGGVKAIGIVNGGWLNDEIRGTEMNALMHSTDWFVTLQSIAGLEPSVDYLLDGLDQTDNLMNGNGLDIYNPREVLLHNAHEVNGALRYRDWKLIRPSDLTNINETDSGLRKKCHSMWCVNVDENKDLNPTIKCWEETESDHPTIDMDTGCSYNEDFCLFNIKVDPCEFNDVKNDEPDIFEKLKQILVDFQGAAAPPKFDMFPEDYDAADPVQFDGVWSPWMGLDDDSEEELLSLQESVVTRSQPVGVMQNLLASSAGILVVFGVLLFILQIATRYIKPPEKKEECISGYGAV